MELKKSELVCKNWRFSLPFVLSKTIPWKQENWWLQSLSVRNNSSSIQIFVTFQNKNKAGSLALFQGKRCLEILGKKERKTVRTYKIWASKRHLWRPIHNRKRQGRTHLPLFPCFHIHIYIFRIFSTFSFEFPVISTSLRLSFTAYRLFSLLWNLLRKSGEQTESGNIAWHFIQGCIMRTFGILTVDSH